MHIEGRFLFFSIYYESRTNHRESQLRKRNLYSWLASINRCYLKFIRIITTCRVKDRWLVIDEFGLCPDIRLNDNQTFIDVKIMIDVCVSFPIAKKKYFRFGFKAFRIVSRLKDRCTDRVEFV